ncbi:MAG: diguanylate cyclase [Dictyoglomus turgidum]|nr:MAG: diguanylate cyclase [Dictyoglomus turgidum]
MLSFHLLALNLRERVTKEVEAYKRTILYIINREKQILKNQIKDYTYWKDLGENAVIKRDKLWIKSNINPWIKNTLGYDVVLFTEDRRVITSSFNFPLNKIPLKREIEISLMEINKDFYLYAVGPVYDENRKKFYGAYLLFARKVDTEYIKGLEEIMGIRLTFVSKDSSNKVSLEDYYKYPYLHMVVPLEDGIYVVMDKEDTSLHEFNKMILIIFGISLGIILILSISLIRVLLNITFKPFEKLVEVSHKIANGEYEIELIKNRDDELGDFIKAFTYMISKIKEREEKLKWEKRETEKLAYLDHLTGVYNRRFLEESYEDIKRNHSLFSLVFVDLDNFKNINDRWGHELGDRVLVNVSEFFKKNFRDYDILVRYGGDEFCIILLNIDKDTAEKIVHRVKEKFEIEMMSSFGLNLSFTYGIAEYPKDGEDLNTLLKVADERMYKYKD